MESEKSAVASAAERFFRLYAKQCLSPDEDSLLALLESLHGLNDKLRKGEQTSLFGSAEFTALKALRNLFHHEKELLHRIRIVPAAQFPISTDLLILCLVDRVLVDQAFDKMPTEDRLRARGTLKWYGRVVNIQPCIFNVAVDVYEVLMPLNLDLRAKDFLEFQECYLFEQENGYTHRVSGDLICLAGDVDAIFKTTFE